VSGHHRFDCPDGVSLQLAGGGTDNITVTEVGGGTTASDLGSFRPQEPAPARL
jgi:hypothetical protein